jgi:hypothetical protein
MLERKVLVLKLLSIDRFASSAIVRGEVTTLAHELFDHPVEGGVLVVQRLFGDGGLSLFAGAEGAEVLGGLGNDYGVWLGRGEGGSDRNGILLSLYCSRVRLVPKSDDESREKRLLYICYPSMRQGHVQRLTSSKTMRPTFFLPMLMSKKTRLRSAQLLLAS